MLGTYWIPKIKHVFLVLYSDPDSGIFSEEQRGGYFESIMLSKDKDQSFRDIWTFSQISEKDFIAVLDKLKFPSSTSSPTQLDLLSINLKKASPDGPENETRILSQIPEEDVIEVYL